MNLDDRRSGSPDEKEIRKLLLFNPILLVY